MRRREWWKGCGGDARWREMREAVVVGLVWWCERERGCEEIGGVAEVWRICVGGAWGWRVVVRREMRGGSGEGGRRSGEKEGKEMV